MRESGKGNSIGSVEAVPRQDVREAGSDARSVVDAVVDRLCCPSDGGALQFRPDTAASLADADALVCADCQTSYPIVDSIPRFVESDQYATNFSLEWTLHRKTQLDDERSRVSEETFAEKTGLTPESVAGKVILDVGCGMGRFADVAVRWGGTVIGVDLSLAVNSAQNNLADTGRFQAVQASVFDLPFKPGAFDIIYSLGVLHHTPDCARAFACLPPLLGPEGILAVWLYSKHVYPPQSMEERRDALYRKVTTRMSPRLLHTIFRALCAIRIPGRPFWHLLLPGFIFHAVPRLQSYARYDWRVLDAFDWYSPMYQSKHSYPEVCRWFREAGFRDIQPLDADVAVWGRK